MTNPVKVSTDPTTGERYYTLDDENYISVTTALSKGIVKGGLDAWKAKLYRQAAIDQAKEIADLIRDGKTDEANSLLEDHFEHESSKGRSNGSVVHEAIEAEIRTGKALNLKNKTQQQYLDSFRRFCDDYQPEFVHIEVACFNRARKYAGRLDACIKTAEWGLSFIDWKTTRPGRHGHGIYPETALQLNAYSYCDLMVSDEGERFPLPLVDTLLGVNVRPSKYAVVPIERSEKIFNYFKACLKTSEWANGVGFHFLGRKVEG